MSETPSLRRFVFMVLLLLVPSFTLWVISSPWIAGPIVWFCDFLFPLWMPGAIAGVELQGSEALVVTQFGELQGELVAAQEAGYQMGFPTDLRLLTYSIPFYAALHFATQQDSPVVTFVLGLWVLIPLIVLGVIGVTLKNLMVAVGEPFFIQQPVGVPSRPVIAMFYQLSILIVPSVSPIVLWIWQSRENPILAQYFTQK